VFFLIQEYNLKNEFNCFPPPATQMLADFETVFISSAELVTYFSYYLKKNNKAGSFLFVFNLYSVLLVGKFDENILK
jgi:hypothetical protein